MKQVNRDFFSVWTPEMAYILGFWFADGWMSQPDKDCHITFTSADLAHLKAIQAALASEQKIYTRAGAVAMTLPSEVSKYGMTSIVLEGDLQSR
jgi:hypothetical protein